MKKGSNRSGKQQILCRYCKKTYTTEAIRNAYSEEIRSLALKAYYSGVSGRGVGKMFGMNKANVYNWIKKKQIRALKPISISCDQCNLPLPSV